MIIIIFSRVIVQSETRWHSSKCSAPTAAMSNCSVVMTAFVFRVDDRCGEALRGKDAVCESVHEYLTIAALRESSHLKINENLTLAKSGARM